MTTYNKIIQADRRLNVLEVLHQDADYSHNEHILKSVLESLGHGISTDLVRTELRWLEEQGLVSVEDIGSVLVARLTERGVDVALGRSRVDGIARPRP